MDRFFRATPAWLALIVAGLLVVGCGGSDSEPASTSETSEQSQTAPETDAAETAESEAAQAADSGNDEVTAGEMPASEPEPMPESDTVETAEADQSPSASADASAGQAAEAEDVVTVDEDGVAQVTIGGNDQMQYTVHEFSVEAGQEVELTFVHEGNLPVEAMGHNVVILPAGEDYVAFAQKVQSEGGRLENDYLPESMREGLIAHTDMVGGGETSTVRFTAPETPGEYPYLCTFPAHYATMNGIMTVL